MAAELITEKNKFTPSFLKEILLAIFGIVAIYFFGYFLNLVLNTLSGASAVGVSLHQPLLFSAISFAIFLIIFFFQTIFIKSRWQGNLIILLEIIFLTLALKINLSKWFLIGLVLFFLILLYGNFLAKKQAENVLKIDFLKM